MMQLKIPPPLYAIVIAASMWFLSLYFPIATVFTSPWNYLGIVMIVVAATFDLWSLLLFFKKRTTPNPLRPQLTTGLVTDGLYKISRNPMYVGLLFILLGIAVLLGSLSPFFLVPAFYFVITEMQIKPEEKVLEEKFCEEYLAYKNRVRRWL